MLFINQKVENQDLDIISNFFAQFDNEFEAVKTIDENVEQNNSLVSTYISSLVSGQYQKSIQDIENTKIGNKNVRKKNLKQVMKESFFYGANRFGNNFIA